MDTLWLGRYSADAVGALSLAFPLIFFLISVGGGFTAAGSILVAQYTGAGGERSAGLIAGQTLSFVTIVAVCLSALGYVLTDPLLALFPADEATARQIIPLAADYMRVFFLGAPALFGFFVFDSLMRGYGNTRTPMMVMLVSVVVNVVIDPLFIFGFGPIPEMGVEGAAVATVISRGLATVIGMYVLFGTDAGPDILSSDLVPDPARIREIVRVGVPTALEQSTSSLAMISLSVIVATYSPAVVAAYGLGNRLTSFAFLPAMGLGRATNTMVGQNLGAGENDRAEAAVWLAAKIAATVLLAVAVVAVLFPRPIVAVFMATGTEQAAATVSFGSDYLRIKALDFAFMGVLQVMLGAYRGAGSTKTAMAFSIVTLWLGRVPAVYLLAVVADLGPTGIWIGMAVGNVVGAIAAGLWFTRGTWKRTVVDAAAAADLDAPAARAADSDD